MAAPAPTKPRSPFGHWLRTTLEANKAAGRKPDSIRSLAKTMANGNPSRGDVHKRSLYKWIRVDGKETKPSEASRCLIAEALDVDVSEVPGDDDEEDESSMSLDDFLRLRIRRLFEEERATHNQEVPA